MGEIASASQLRMSFIRWAAFTVPLIVFLGFFAGRLGGSGFGNGWFLALERPDWFPPGWLFGAVWSLLYVLLGIALAMILDARRAAGRAKAISLFAVQFALNLAWSPLFFAAHQVTLAFWLLLVILVLTILTAWAFRTIRPVAFWLLLPYLAWLAFAAVLAFEMDRLNPDAETMQPPSGSAEFIL